MHSSFTYYIVDKKIAVSGEILKYTSNRHFTIPKGHQRTFVNGSKAMQLALIGHIKNDNST